jgi:hypothetical protein
VLSHQAQPDQAAPVLADQRDVLQVERVEERGAHPLDVPRVGVVLVAHRLVGATEADQVRRHDPEAGLQQHRTIFR